MELEIHTSQKKAGDSAKPMLQFNECWQIWLSERTDASVQVQRKEKKEVPVQDN